MKKKFFIVILVISIFISLAIVFLSALDRRHKATAAFGFNVLGGIQFVRACTCSNSLLLTIGPPREGDFLFQFGISRLFSFYTIKAGSYAIGIAAPVQIACLVYAGTGCVQQGQGKPIIIMGTSK